MRAFDIEIQDILDALRRKISERGFTQLEIQQELRWGKTYISQLFTRRKELRADQVLLILDAIDVEPREFFAEIYGQTTIQTMPEEEDHLELVIHARQDLFENPLLTVQNLHFFVGKLVKVLIRNKLVTREELAARLGDSQNSVLQELGAGDKR